MSGTQNIIQSTRPALSAIGFYNGYFTDYRNGARRITLLKNGEYIDFIATQDAFGVIEYVFPFKADKSGPKMVLNDNGVWVREMISVSPSDTIIEFIY